MTYQHIGDAIQSQQFIARVDGCVIDLVAAITAATQDGGSIQNDTGGDLTTLACKNWSINYLKGSTAATTAIVGKFMLLNGNLAADPYGNSTGDDAAMNWQLKHVFLTLVGMG